MAAPTAASSSCLIPHTKAKELPANRATTAAPHDLRIRPAMNRATASRIAGAWYMALRMVRAAVPRERLRHGGHRFSRGPRPPHARAATAPPSDASAWRSTRRSPRSSQ